MDHGIVAAGTAGNRTRRGLMRRAAARVLALGLAVPLLAGPAFGKDAKDAAPQPPPRKLNPALATSLTQAVDTASGGESGG